MSVGKCGDPDQFRRLLDEQNQWPARFTFKFIVPRERLGELETLLHEFDLTNRASSRGNYISVTFEPVMPSSKAVLDVYERVAHVEGIVSL